MYQNKRAARYYKKPSVYKPKASYTAKYPGLNVLRTVPARSKFTPLSLYRKRSTRSYTRKSHYSRYRRHYKRRPNRFAIVNRTKEVIADTFITKLVYQGIKQHSAMTTYTEYAIALNNIADAMPNASSTQRPLGYDELEFFYNEYRVYGARIDVHVANLSDTLVCMGFFSTTLTPGVGTTGVPSPLEYTGLQHMEEDREVSHIYINKQDGRKTFSKYYSVAKCFGVSKQTVDTDDTFKANFGGTPSQSCWVRWGIAPVGGVASNVDITFNITYYVKCYEKKTIIPSMIKQQQIDLSDTDSDSDSSTEVALEELVKPPSLPPSPIPDLTKSDIELIKSKRPKLKFEDLSKV